MKKLPDYETINHILLENRIFIEAAEAHGLLTGLLVCDKNASAEAWITLMTAQENASENMLPIHFASLVALRKTTEQQLRDVDFHFELLLEPDTALLSERVRSLGLWCKGFVTGMESYGNYLGELIGRAQEEVSEALEDLKTISNVDEHLKEYEAHEKAFTSVVEYVRIAVLLVQRELSDTPKNKNIH